MSVFKGWICRVWTETTDGFQSKIYRVDTEEAAIKIGMEKVNRPFMQHEISREFEVYKDYKQTWEAEK